MLPQVAQTLPEDVQMTPLFRSVLFVAPAIEGVLGRLRRRALTAGMISFFLGNWRTLSLQSQFRFHSQVIILLSAIGETSHHDACAGAPLVSL